jgi:hypothetical protein
MHCVLTYSLHPAPSALPILQAVFLQSPNQLAASLFSLVQHVTAADEAAGTTAREQWVVCPLVAPDVPEGFKLMASEHLPISTYHFYEQFLSVEATCLQDHHRSTGQYDFRSSRCADVRPCVTSYATADCRTSCVAQQLQSSSSSIAKQRCGQSSHELTSVVLAAYAQQCCS